MTSLEHVTKQETRDKLELITRFAVERETMMAEKLLVKMTAFNFHISSEL